MSQHDGWVRQFFIIWIVQFFSIAGFCMGLPFIAYYIQELGVSGESEVLWWTTAFAVTAPLFFSIGAPFWGIMADRFGRKKMLFRANVCASLILFGMAWAPSVIWLIVFRVCQGLFTGVLPAAQTLLAVSTPGHRQGMALGSLAAAVAGGIGIGSAMGGRVAEMYGYREAFFIGGILSVIATLLVLFGAVEKHEAKSEKISRKNSNSVLIFVLPVLMLMAMVSIMSNVDNATFPLLIQKLNGSIEGASVIVGDIYAISGIAFSIGGLMWGWCADKFGPYKILVLCACLAAAASIPLIYVDQILPIYFIVLCIALSMAGIDPVLQVLLSRQTPAERRGSVFGWAGTARSIGWMGGPLFGSYLAYLSNYQEVYWMRVAMLVLMLPVCWWSYCVMREFLSKDNAV